MFAPSLLRQLGGALLSMAWRKLSRAFGFSTGVDAADCDAFLSFRAVHLICLMWHCALPIRQALDRATEKPVCPSLWMNRGGSLSHRW